MEFEYTPDEEIMFENGVWSRGIEPPGDAWKSFGQTLLERMKTAPEGVAQIDGLTGEEDTYVSMLERTVRCALWLREQNVKAGDVIGICTPYHLNTIIPVLAAIFNGVTFHPWWDMALEDDMVEFLLKLGEPKVMFVNKGIADSMRRAINDLSMDTKLVVFEDSPYEVSFVNILEEQNAEDVANFECARIENIKQPALMLNTSGTAGYPKGVLHSYSWLAKYCHVIPDRYVAGSRMLWFSGISWITAIASTISLVKNLATAVVYSKPNAETAYQLIEKYNINIVMGTVAIANQFYKNKDHMNSGLSSVKYFWYGGANVNEEIQQHLEKIFPNAILWFSYGCTEVGSIVGRDQSTYKVNSCGKIEGKCQVKVIDTENGKTLAANEEGEICVKSPYLLLSYHKDQESTEKAIDVDGWYHTGDLAYYDCDGDFFIIDRIKEVIKYKIVEPIVPSQIERVIMKHPDIQEVAVVAKPDLVDVEQPMAFVTTRTGSKVTAKDIIKLVENNLPDAMRLRGGVKILEKMPITPSGKIARRILRQLAKDFTGTGVIGNFSGIKRDSIAKRLLFDFGERIEN